jgi:hypothetical protein
VNTKWHSYSGDHRIPKEALNKWISDTLQ